MERPRSEGGVQSPTGADRFKPIRGKGEAVKDHLAPKSGRRYGFGKETLKNRPALSLSSCDPDTCGSCLPLYWLRSAPMSDPTT